MNIAVDRLTRQRLIGFAVVVASVLGSVRLTASPTDARAMMESLGNAVAASAYAFEGDVRVAMTVSIGVVIAGAERDVDTLLKRTEAAMYAAKDNGLKQTRLARVQTERLFRRHARHAEHVHFTGNHILVRRCVRRLGSLARVEAAPDVAPVAAGCRL